ncbi:TIGR04133 family radical SAM/SPASM protein [Bacteroidota bacterium]
MTDKIPLKKKIALELYRKYKKNTTKLHKLSYLFWECTLRCNLNCRHCGSDCKTNPEQKDMAAEDFLKAIDQIKPHVNPNELIIAITGGEPLLRSDLEMVGKELHNRGFPWGIVTNGYLLSKDRLVSLLKSGLRSITISLDGQKESHNWLRGNNQSYIKALNAIGLVSSVKDLVFDVVSCVNQKNIDDLPILKDLLVNLGVKNWRLFTISPIGRAKEDDLLHLNPDQFKELFEYIKTIRKEGEIKASYGCEGFLGSYESEVRDNFFFCRAGVNIASVLVDGSISACPNLRSNFVQGNIYEDDFMDIWNIKFSEMRNRKWTYKGVCADCNHYKYCNGNGLHLYTEDKELTFCHLEKLLHSN